MHASNTFLRQIAIVLLLLTGDLILPWLFPYCCYFGSYCSHFLSLPLLTIQDITEIAELCHSTTLQTPKHPLLYTQGRLTVNYIYTPCLYPPLAYVEHKHTATALRQLRSEHLVWYHFQQVPYRIELALKPIAHAPHRYISTLYKILHSHPITLNSLLSSALFYLTRINFQSITHTHPSSFYSISDRNSFTASGEGTPGDGRPDLKLGRRDIFFSARYTSFHIISSHLLPLFLYFISLFCSYVQVFGKALLHEFLISYSHTEWNLQSSLSEKHVDEICKQIPLKQNSKQIN